MQQTRTFAALLAVLALLVLPLTALAQPGSPPGSGEGTILAASGAIALGETVEGTLSEDEPAIVYTFEGEAGQAVTITLISDDFDPYLVLEDADGGVLDTDDDSAGSLDSRIGPFTLPADGTYRIGAYSFASYSGGTAAEGDFTLSVAEVELLQIEYSQTIEGTLTAQETAHEYRFTGQSGDGVVIRLSSDDFDSYLRRLDETGLELASNDDGGGSLNSLIGPFNLPATGTYVIRASSLGGSATGDYTLALERVELAQIAYGDEVEVEFTPQEQSFFFTFEGTVGEVVNIEVDGDDVDTTLTLQDPYNYQAFVDEDSGSSWNPEILDYVLTQSGTYTLILSTTTGASGTVTMTFERGQLPSLDQGAQTVTFSSSQTTRALVFTGEAGVEVRLNVARLAQDGSGSPSLEVTQDGSSLSYISASGVSGFSVDFVVPADGEVIINFSDYSYTSVSYEVSLTKPE